MIAVPVFSSTLIGDTSVEKTQLAIDRSDNQAIEFELSFAGVQTQKVSHGFRQYDLLTMEREGVSGVIGAPEVPLVTRLFAIPDRAKVKIASVEPEYRIYNDIYPFPHQEYEYGHPDLNADLSLANEYYKSGEFFPQNWVEIGEPAILRDFRIIPVTVSPIRINASTGEAMVLTNLRVRLEFEDGSTVNVKTHHFDKTVSSFDKIYQNVIANYDWVNPNGVELFGTIMIIYPNATGVYSTIQPYIEWKKRKGYNVIVQQETNNASTTTVKNHIQTVYNTADPPLESVILIGDTDGAVAIQCYFYSSGSSDHNYTQLDGADLLGDITIGRITVDNTTHLATAVNKMLYYETNPDTVHTDWYKKGAVMAGSASSGLSTIQLSQNIRSWWLDDEGYTVVDTLWYNMGGSIESFMESHCEAGITTQNYRGYLGVNGVTYSDVMNNFDNPFKLPFDVTITCGTGDFGSTYSDDIIEAWIRAGSPSTPKGGIGSVGTATSSTHTRYNNTINGGLWFGFTKENLHTMGESLFRGKLELYLAYQQDLSGQSNFTYWNNLMGDPTIDVYTDVPHMLQVTHPTEIAVGTSSFSVVVEDRMGNPLADRYVCLLKEGEVSTAGRTDENGEFTAAIDVSTAGTLKLTITYHNNYPYIFNVPVVVEDVYPSFSNLTIIDDGSGSSQGNGDGWANPSEVLDLEVELRNFGTSVTASGINATLTSSDPNVTVIQGTTTYNNLAPGGSAVGNSDFTVEMGCEFPQGYVVRMDLLVETNQGDFTSSFDLEVNSGELIPTSYTATGGSFNPGDTDEITITLRNVGQLNLTGVTAVLTSDDPQISIDDSVGTFGNINVGQYVSNDSDPFVITADEFATRGRISEMMLTVNSSNGCEQHIFVKITIGQFSQVDPIGPDEHGYYCIDDEDTDYSGRPIYNWIEIDPNYGGSGTQLNLPDYSEEQDVSIAFPIPFTFTYYGEDFDSITVCSNGWIGMGNLAYFDDFRNYQIPSAFGPNGGMICPYWDDIILGSGHIYAYEDNTNHRIIVEWSRVDLMNSGSQIHTFEVILYDPVYYPTPTGDGDIVFQYHTVLPTVGPSWDNDYFTTGIQNIDHSGGIEYAYWNVYNPGATIMQNNKAIKFTTVEPIREEFVPSVNLTVEPQGLPIVIPSGGGSFQFDVILENTANYMQILDFWVIVTLPSGSIYGPVFLRTNFVIGPMATASRLLTQIVPAGAPTGDYTYSCFIGDYEHNIVWESDSFEFSKSGAADGSTDEWITYGWEEQMEAGANQLPQSFLLHNAVPNPFNPATEIKFDLPDAGNVKLTVFNSLGRQIAVLKDEWMPAGWHSITFDAQNNASGIYFYNLEAEGFSQTKKMLLIK